MYFNNICRQAKRSAPVVENVVEETDECVLAFADLLETSEILLAPLWNSFSKTGKIYNIYI